MFKSFGDFYTIYKTLKLLGVPDDELKNAINCIKFILKADVKHD